MTIERLKSPFSSSALLRYKSLSAVTLTLNGSRRKAAFLQEEHLAGANFVLSCSQEIDFSSAPANALIGKFHLPSLPRMRCTGSVYRSNQMNEASRPQATWSRGLDTSDSTARRKPIHCAHREEQSRSVGRMGCGRFDRFPGIIGISSSWAVKRLPS